jgi:DNA-binding HxlR family transcriptional regulator
VTGVTVININSLLEIAEIFRFRWDTATLACLDKPTRFRALARKLGADLGDRVEDNSLSRSLKRLRRTGLVTARHRQIGGRVVPYYELTERGRQRRAQYEALVFTYQELAIPNGNGKGSNNGRNPDAAAGSATPGFES